jgi:uncharacterized membrane-anchored protein
LNGKVSIIGSDSRVRQPVPPTTAVDQCPENLCVALAEARACSLTGIYRKRQEQNQHGLNSMHPQRQTLHNELHARPSLYFDEPAHVFHLAFLGGDLECNCCGSMFLDHDVGVST